MIRFDSMKMLNFFLKKDIIKSKVKRQTGRKYLQHVEQRVYHYPLYKKSSCKLIRKAIQLLKKVIHKIIQFRNSSHQQIKTRLVYYFLPITVPKVKK